MKRNEERFPEDFCFKLNSKEFKSLRCQNVTFNQSTLSKKYLPYVFIEHGIVALAGVLKSDIAATNRGCIFVLKHIPCYKAC